MKQKLFGYFLALTIAIGATRSFAQAQTQSAVTTELKAEITKIQEKLKAGKKTEAELADNLKEFDVILAKHKNEKTDDVAQVLYMKLMLYMQIFHDWDKSADLAQQLKRDFPATKMGQNADKIIANIDKQKEGAKIKAAFSPGAKFPDFNEKDINGKSLSVANYKGKVVLIDFWATWCGPCVGELPNVQKIYTAQHEHGFEIIGISLDSDKDKLTSFLKSKNMTWQQYFDGKGWENKLAEKYAVQSIPETYLIDKNGNIIAEGLRGEELSDAVAKALAAK